MKTPSKAQCIVYRLIEAYAGFDAEYLNSNQSLPKHMTVVYKTMHKPWLMVFARRVRDRYGINLWVDGTVTKGWKLIVHVADAERANAMLASVI